MRRSHLYSLYPRPSETSSSTSERLIRSFKHARSDDKDESRPPKCARTPSPRPHSAPTTPSTTPLSHHIPSSPPLPPTTPPPLLPSTPSTASSFAADTATCFGSSPDISGISLGSGDSADDSSQSTDTHDSLDESSSDNSLRERFWPNRGAKRDRPKIAKRYGRDTIRRLPRSEVVDRWKTCDTMTKDDVAARIAELFLKKPRPLQIDTVYRVACQKQSMILTAKTGVAKSLIFEVIPLLNAKKPGIALVVMPLKIIQQQQLEKINKIPGAKAVVYDGDHNDLDTRMKIAAGHFTHVFIGPELILSKEFHEDVIKADMFRRRLMLFAIDEIHCVENWKNFRPKYAELAVLRARLPRIPYLGVTATLAVDKVQAIQIGTGFNPDDALVRTCVDRAEISTHVLFMKGAMNSFEDLRGFFPLWEDAHSAVNIPKTVFYFDSIRILIAFVRIVYEFWMPEFGYPPGSECLIQAYFATMSDPDKQRVSKEFEKVDNFTEPSLSSSIRFLAATEGYGMGADNPDITNVIQYRISEHLDSLIQRKGRASRNGLRQGRFFFVVDRYASEARLPAKPTTKNKRSNPSQMDYLLATQTDSEAENQAIEDSNTSTIDAQRRLKRQRAMIEFINEKRCYRLAELKYYGDTTYEDSLHDRPIECCSLCTKSMLIPPFRPNLPAKKGDILFEAWMTKRLEEWRHAKAVVLTRNSVVPCLGSLIMPDVIVRRIAKYPRDITDESSLRAFCRHWGELDMYKDDILEICRYAVANSGAGSELFTMDRARINMQNNPRRKIQPAQPPPPILSEAERARAKYLEEKLQRYNSFMIKYGLPAPAKKPQRSKKSSKVSSQTQPSSQVDSSQIEGSSQGEDSYEEASQPGPNSFDRVSQGI